MGSILFDHALISRPWAHTGCPQSTLKDFCLLSMSECFLFSSSSLRSRFSPSSFSCLSLLFSASSRATSPSTEGAPRYFSILHISKIVQTEVGDQVRLDGLQVGVLLLEALLAGRHSAVPDLVPALLPGRVLLLEHVLLQLAQLLERLDLLPLLGLHLLRELGGLVARERGLVSGGGAPLEAAEPRLLRLLLLLSPADAADGRPLQEAVLQLQRAPHLLRGFDPRKRGQVQERVLPPAAQPETRVLHLALLVPEQRSDEGGSQLVLQLRFAAQVLDLALAVNYGLLAPRDDGHRFCLLVLVGRSGGQQFVHHFCQVFGGDFFGAGAYFAQKLLLQRFEEGLGGFLVHDGGHLKANELLILIIEICKCWNHITIIFFYHKYNKLLITIVHL